MEHLNKRKTAFTYILFALITYIIIYLSSLSTFLEPLLFSKIMGEKYSEFFSAIFSFIILAFTLLAIILLFRKLGLTNIFKFTRERLSLKNSLIIFALVFVSLFAVGASLGFDLRILVDLGACLTQTDQSTIIATYALNLLQLFLALAAAIYFGQGLEMLLPKTKIPIPYVAIILLFAYGVFNFFTMNALLATRLVFLAVSFVFGIIYYFSKRSLFTTYMLAVIIFLL